jgi:hypothetical protein
MIISTSLPNPTADGLVDKTPLEPDELCDQCRALCLAITEICNPVAKEILNFVLLERLNLLNDVLAFSANDEDVMDQIAV